MYREDEFLALSDFFKSDKRYENNSEEKLAHDIIETFNKVYDLKSLDSYDVVNLERAIKKLFLSKEYLKIVLITDFIGFSDFSRECNSYKFLSYVFLDDAEKAYSLWCQNEFLLPINTVVDNITSIRSEPILIEAIRKLALECEEDFTITPLDNLLYRMFRQNKNKFNYFRELISLNSIDVSYYTRAMLGLLKTLEYDFIKKVLETNDKKIILRVFSFFKIHERNLKSLYGSGLLNELSHPVLKLAYEKFDYKQKKEVIFPTAWKKKRLKIALCVSGQLRGYKDAFKSWGVLGLNEHDLDTYVCVWKDIGRKRIDGNKHLDRIFTPNVAQCFSDIVFNKKKLFLNEKFPALVSFINEKNAVDTESLKQFYSTNNVVVIEDDLYGSMSNTEKMYMMMNRCWDMIDDPNQYDLIIRIRPDKEFIKFEDLLYGLLITSERPSVIPDKAASVHTGDIYMGDQFAFGKPHTMSVYSNTYSRYLEQTDLFSIQEYSKLKPHTSLAASMLLNGIDIVDAGDSLVFGGLLDPSKIEPDVLIGLLETDEDESNKHLIQLIKKSIEKDIKEVF